MRLDDSSARTRRQGGGMLPHEIAHTFVVITLVLLAAVLHANATPAPRDIGAFYFNGTNQSQVWVDLDPAQAGGGEGPARVNLTIKFSGRELAGPPKTVTIRATSKALVAPTKIRLPILTFHLSDDTVIDLTGPGAVYAFTASCERCASDTLLADVSFSTLQQMTASSVILVNALGFEGRLSPEDVAAIRRLVDAVQNGVRVSDH
jgi:hypothetical protein